MKHLVLISDLELQNIISGQQQYLIRFYKKIPEFLGEIALGDLVYFRKRGSEVLGQFNISKLVIFEGIEDEDLKTIKEKFNLKDKAGSDGIAVIIKIAKLEQFITSPIEMPYNLRKDWLVLESA